jgi:hypothetical protein
MNRSDPIVSLELPAIQRIIDDETWLESERRGYRVMPEDQVVREKVCQVVLRIGAQLRAAAERALGNAPLSA